MKSKALQICLRVGYALALLVIWELSSGIFDEYVNDTMNMPPDWVITVPGWYQTIVYWAIPVTLLVLFLVELRLRQARDKAFIWMCSWALIYGWNTLAATNIEDILKRADIAKQQHPGTMIVLHMGFKDIQPTISLLAIIFAILGGSYILSRILSRRGAGRIAASAA